MDLETAVIIATLSVTSGFFGDLIVRYVFRKKHSVIGIVGASVVMYIVFTRVFSFAVDASMVVSVAYAMGEFLSAGVRATAMGK